MRFLLLPAVLFLLVFPLAADDPKLLETGIASWYGGEFDGELTANGEVFDTAKVSAAHKTLPFGTIVRVTNLNNGLRADIRINDRGPFVEGRIIDLSVGAAELLDMVESGIAPVTLEIIFTPDIPESAYLRLGDTGWVTIQVGAYQSAEWAINRYTLLRAYSYSPVIEKTDDGFYRLIIPDIPLENLEAVLVSLKEIGFADPLPFSQEKLPE